MNDTYSKKKKNLTKHLLLLMLCFFKVFSALAQASSGEEMLFKLKPYKNVCVHTYRLYELGQEAQKFAEEGALSSYEKNQIETATVLPRAFAETKTGSPCCEALAKIGYPCGGSSRSGSIGAGTGASSPSNSFYSQQQALSSSMDSYGLALDLSGDNTSRDNIDSQVSELQNALKELTEEIEAENKNPAQGNANGSSPSSHSLNGIKTREKSYEQEAEELDRLLKEMELDFMKMFKDIFASLFKLWGGVGAGRGVSSGFKGALEKYANNAFSQEMQSYDEVIKLTQSLEKGLQREAVNAVRMETLDVLHKGMRLQPALPGIKNTAIKNLKFNR